MHSLQRHGIEEAQKQLPLRIKNRGLTGVKVEVSRRAGRLQFGFSGPPAEVQRAEKILADWN